MLVAVEAKSNDPYMLKWLNDLVQASLDSQRRLSDRVVMHLHTAVAVVVSTSESRRWSAYRDALSSAPSHTPSALVDSYLQSTRTSPEISARPLVDLRRFLELSIREHF